MDSMTFSNEKKIFCKATRKGGGTFRAVFIYCSRAAEEAALPKIKFFIKGNQYSWARRKPGTKTRISQTIFFFRSFFHLSLSNPKPLPFCLPSFLPSWSLSFRLLFFRY
jgi:hypothetical protein